MTQPVELAPAVAPTDPRPRAGAEIVPRNQAATAAANEAPQPPQASAPSLTTNEASATRLLVEPGKSAQGFVYKLVDRNTGKVLSEFPFEAASTLSQSAGYQAGTVLDESV